MIDITFRQLDVFVRIVESGSFRCAADELSISQVSVSAHVRALEGHLGVALFERRRGTTAQLSAAGELTYKRAKELLQGRAALANLRPERTSSTGATTLRIAAHGYIAERFSRPLAEFKARHPEIDIGLERRPFEGMLQGLQKPDFEVGLFLARGPVPQLSSIRVSQEEIAFYVGRKHPLARRDVVSPPELCEYPFYYLPPGSHLRTQVNSLLAEVGICGCPTALISDDHMLISESLTDGKSFACLFTRGTDLRVEAGQLRRLTLDRPVPPMEVRYCVCPSMTLNPAADLLADCLSETMRSARALSRKSSVGSSRGFQPS